MTNIKGKLAHLVNLRKRSEFSGELWAGGITREATEKRINDSKNAYKNASLEQKIDILADSIFDVENTVHDLKIRLIFLERNLRNRAWKTSLLLVLLAAFLPLYVTTSRNIWLILALCTLGLYLLEMFYRMWKAKRFIDWTTRCFIEDFYKRVEKNK